MVFKTNAYRLGHGRNIHGVADDNSFRLYYKTSDENNSVVKCKRVVRRAGYVEVKMEKDEYEASSAVPLGDYLYIHRGGEQVKVIDNLNLLTSNVES